MRVELLEVDAFEFIDIKEYSSKILPNEHGRLCIGGLIAGENLDNYLASRGKCIKVRAKTYEDNEDIIFCGMVTACRIKSNGDVHYMTLELMTQSLKMDTSKHIRTFQKDKMSYKEILSAIVKRYSRGGLYHLKNLIRSRTGLCVNIKKLIGSI